MGQRQITEATTSGLVHEVRGGNNLEQRGGNCNLLYAGTDCIMFDCGRHRTRPSPEGWVQDVPDIRDLLHPDSPHRLRAIFLSHAHWDHDEGLIRYLAMGHTLPPVYGNALTMTMLREKLLQAHIPKARWPELYICFPDRPLSIGAFTVEAVQMGHSLPGYGYLARANGAGVFITSDFKLDETLLSGRTNKARLARMGENREVDLLLFDGARSNDEGCAIPEAIVRENLHRVAEQHPHHRLNFIISGVDAEAIMRASWVAKTNHRFLVHHGASLKRTLRALRKSGLDPEYVVNCTGATVVSGATNLAQRASPSYVLNLLAGGQAETGSVLQRASEGSVDALRFGPADVVVLSAETMSWNLPRMQDLFNRLRAQGVEHIYVDAPGEHTYKAPAHEQAEGKRQLIALVKPQHAAAAIFAGLAQREAARQLVTGLPLGIDGLTVENGTQTYVSRGGVHLFNHRQTSTLPLPAHGVLPLLQPPVKTLAALAAA